MSVVTLLPEKVGFYRVTTHTNDSVRLSVWCNPPVRPCPLPFLLKGPTSFCIAVLFLLPTYPGIPSCQTPLPSTQLSAPTLPS